MRLGAIAWRTVQLVALGGMALLVGGLFWPTSTPSGTITYALDWETNGVVSTADGIVIETDLGYVVTLTEATVWSWSTTTVACEHDDRFSIWDSAAGLVEASLGAEPAAAGHGDVDQAELVAPTIETLVRAAELTDATTTVLGEVNVSEPTWCEGHWALSGSSGSDQASASSSDPTLALSGSVTSPDGTVSPLDISTDIAWGAKAELLTVDGTGAQPETGEPISITVVRDLASTFDGIDFAEFDPDDLAATGANDALAVAVLRNLDGNTSFVVTATTVAS